ncbi:MAG: Abi family protein [Acetobacterium sp.]|nr:Abi family protein [Acetobacterium sp.]
MKPFHTLDEQVEKLKSRELIVDDVDFAKSILSKENYYNVVNGYKKPFLKRDLGGALLQPEVYVEGCRFEELYSLYCYDRDLRMLLLGVLLKFETHFKTSCAYNFSDEYRDSYAYLNVGNYSQKKEDLTKVLKNISVLSSELNKNTNGSRAKSVYISHYIENHKCVPLWVLINSLTIGNMSYFYSAIDERIRAKIAKGFSSDFKKEYDSNEKVDTSEMAQIVKAVNLFRNVCAHEEILFLFKLNTKLKSTLFTKYFKSGAINQEKIEKSDLFALVAVLKLVTQKEEYLSFIDNIDTLFSLYREKFKSVNFDKIIFLSGFHPNWKNEILESI